MTRVFETPCYKDDAVVLAGYDEADVDVHLAGEDEETAGRFGWWPERSTTETVVRAFREWARDWDDDGPTRTFAVRDRWTDVLIGGCQLRRHVSRPWTLSYWTGAPHRRCGVATRALRLLLEFARSQDISTLECEVAEDNVGSRRVAEAAGFIRVDIAARLNAHAIVRYRWHGLD